MAWVTSTPFGRLVVPDVYMIAASSSGARSVPRSSSDWPSTRLPNGSTPSGASSERARTTRRRLGHRPRTASTFGSRSGCVTVITLSEWPTGYASSSGGDSGLVGIITAPILAVANHRNVNSGQFVRCKLTLSPFRTPSSMSAFAVLFTIRSNSR